MNTVNMFGKAYNTIGSSDSNFIIKTKGDLKVQWGGKYIDIIKNGKIVSAKTDIFKEVDSEEEINTNGIYLVNSEQIWVSVEGCKINLSESLSGNVYVSFMNEQPEITSNQKYQALRNIGFFYDTLEQAKQSNITKGIIYVENEHLLYYINNGIITQYVGNSSEQNNKFKELFINSLHIFPDFAQMIFDSDMSIVFKVKMLPVVTINKESVNLNATVNINGDIIGNSFKLYTKNGLSYLEVDNIISKSENIKYTPELSKTWIYFDNIINAISISESKIITCNTLYKNSYKNGDSIYLQLDNSAELIYQNSQYTLSHPVPVDVIIKIKEQLVTIPKGTVRLDFEQGSNDFEIIQGKEYIKQNSFKNKLLLHKYIVSNVTETSFDITLVVEDNTFINRCQNIFTCLANDPILTIDSELKFFEKGKNRTILGNIQNIEQLQQCPVEKEELNYGLFSENFISLNSQHYDTTFKKLCNYPKYDNTIELPQNLNDTQYDSVVPNLSWVKQLINALLPVGSIIMYNGVEIPEGWAICDGQNGTPDLIGKFVKAGRVSEDIPRTDIGLDNQITITQDNLPNHTHTLNTSSIQVVTEVPNTIKQEVLQFKTSQAPILEEKPIETYQTFTNQPIKIEPRAYSLIFIIKLK